MFIDYGASHSPVFSSKRIFLGTADPLGFSCTFVYGAEHMQ